MYTTAFLEGFVAIWIVISVVGVPLLGVAFIRKHISNP